MSASELPPPLRAAEPGTFAQKSLTIRFPKLVDQVMAQNTYPGSIREGLLRLKDELVYQAPARPLVGTQPDVEKWNAQLSAWGNVSWVELPWYFAEALFFRHLLEAVMYFEYGSWMGIDPFQSLKDEQTQKDVRHFEQEAAGSRHFSPEKECASLLLDCLWGNYVDLSNFYTEFASPGSQETQAEALLVNHTEEIAAFLSQGMRSLAYVTDNIGIELFFDIKLIDFLLTAGWVQALTVHLKDHPFFISDAMPKDLLASLRALSKSAAAPVRQMASRVVGYISAGKLQLRVHPLWTSGDTFFNEAGSINRVLEGTEAAVFKGDLNYRRLLGDYHWPPTTRVEKILEYLPIPVILLRTLKSEVIAGLKAGQFEQLSAIDPEWQTGGKKGIVQLVR